MVKRFILVIGVLFCGTACIQPTVPVNADDSIISLETPTLVPTDSPTADPLIIGPDIFASGINPLTGLSVPVEALARRPMNVKISNAPPLVRPQAGIGAADLVFEHYAEGGLTRFSAVFYGQAPDRVGSIRSARLIDYELMPMYQGLLAFSGASIGVEDRLNQSEFADRLYKGVLYGYPYFWRDENIPVPHNMFMNPNALWQLAAEEGLNQTPNLHGMAFYPSPPPGSDGPANVIDLRYRATRVRWEYDPAIQRYRRFADGEGHYDANTLEQVTAANVVVIYADHEFTDIVESQFQGSNSYSIEIKLWFEGDAILFRDGLQYTGRWIRPTRQDLIALRTMDGQFLYLKPGNTFFQVVRLPEQQTPEEEWLHVE
ncbi:MAG: DUF3048 domain-containing protein [Anaerolineae bacterium]|nr:DUF3048 domain-containing protein [Anaerolineae bacterium]